MKCQCCDYLMKYHEEDLYCENCTTLYVPYDSSIIVSQYNENYKDEYARREKLETNELIQNMRWQLVQTHVKEGSVLDMGCGVGAFLKKKPNGFDAYGVEINPHEVECCKEQGLCVSHDIPNNLFDAITFWDVLEHFPDLDILLTLKNKFLKQGGCIFITVPNFTKELLPVIKLWRHYKPNEHIFCFSQNSIKSLCEKFEFNFITQNYDESNHRGEYGSIASYVISS